jgi:hypothetical protein
MKGLKMSLINNMCLYYKDCIREEVKSSSFRNLTGNKDNKLVEVSNNNLKFNLDNEKIIEIMTLSEINKLDRQLIYGEMFITGNINKNVYYTPLRYFDLKLYRQGHHIVGEYDKDNPILNIGAISTLLDNEPELIENSINTLLDYVTSNELETVLKSLVDLKGLRVESNKKAIILAKVPDASAGLIRELDEIAKVYDNIKICK